MELVSSKSLAKLKLSVNQAIKFGLPGPFSRCSSKFQNLGKHEPPRFVKI